MDARKYITKLTNQDDSSLMASFLHSVILNAIILITAANWLTDICYAEDNAKEYYIISSGSQGGSYNQAGTILARSLNKINANHYRFKSISSSGSIENIARLKDRFSDFAIVQRDVFIRNYYGKRDAIKNVSIISPLFQEKLLLYTHNDSHISFAEFRNSLSESSSISTIGVTSLDGASRNTFSKASSLLGLSETNIKFVVGDYKLLTQMFQSNEIDYLLSFSLPLEGFDDTKIVYFDAADIRLLIRRMRHLSMANIDNKDHYTLGVWALFVGLNDSITNLGESEILKHVITSSLTNEPIEVQMSSTFSAFAENSSLYNEYLDGLPIVTSFQLRAGESNFNIGTYNAPLIGILFVVALFSMWIARSRKAKRKVLWVRYKHILIGLPIVAALYWLCLEALVYFEEQFFQENGIKSSILDMTNLDLHLWNLVRIFANNDSGIFPLSSIGKLATTASIFVIWTGVIAFAISEFVVSKLITKRRGGLMNVKDQGHIVIAGWNESTQSLINDLLNACSKYHRRTLKIVCVVPDPKLILETYKDISDRELRKEIVLVKGHIRSKSVLERCNAHKAKIIILLAEEGGVHADEKTLMRALGIRKFCCENESEQTHSFDFNNSTEKDFTSRGLVAIKNKVNPVYLIAEVNTEEFVSDLRDAGVNDVINKNRIADGLLIQSILNPGVSQLMDNILTFSGNTNEFYAVDLLDSKNKHLRNRTFDELLLPLRKQSILLVAIKVIYRDQSGREIVDENEISKLLESEGLNRQIITNPISDTETCRKTDADDQLITLAVSASNLNKGLKSVSFE